MNQPDNKGAEAAADSAAPLRDATDLEVAVYVASAGSVTAATLAKALQVATPRASRRLQHLQGEGLVHKVGRSWQALHSRDRNKRAWNKAREDRLTT